MRASAIAAVFLLALAACGIPAAGPQMDPGKDCMSCHTGSVAPSWTVSGTLFASASSAPDQGLEGGQILITDALNRTLTLNTNGAGNFYTAEDLKPPFRVQAQFGNRRLAMVREVTTGSCNSCHANPGLQDAPGRVFVGH